MTTQEILAERIPDCDVCGRHPAIVCIFYDVEGRIFSYIMRKYLGHLCTDCIKRVYKDYTGDTLVWGFWSIYGFVRAPLVIIGNTYELMSCLIKLRRLSRRMRG